MLTVDANVWVAALDEDDAMHAPSVRFLERAPLITWDGELIDRAGGQTPVQWLAGNS